VTRSPSSADPSGPTSISPTPRRVRWHRLTPALLVAAGLLAAVTTSCAGSDSGSTTTTTAPHAPSSVTVSITDGQFDPRRVEVAVGGSVTWVNDDVTPHLLVSTTPNVIQSPVIGKAGSYTRSFNTPGEYRYYCNIHNSMKGEVVVR
jgi:plastocyanin